MAVGILVRKPQQARSLRVITSAGHQAVMPSAPSKFSYKDVPKFGTVEREGKKALTRLVAPGLRTLSFTQRVASQDYQKSIQTVVQWYTNTASAGARVRFTGGSGPFQECCWWLIKDLSVAVNQLSLDNQVSDAVITWSLEEWQDVTSNVIKPRPKPKPKPAASASAPRAVKAPSRTYRVASGDTLWGIAARFLGNGARWPEIFNLNRGVIGGNPNRIMVGQLYRIPG